MKTLYIVVATRNRYKKLLRLLDSIPGKADGIPIAVMLCFDADSVSFKKLSEHIVKNPFSFVAHAFVSPLHRGSVFCRNFLLERTDDAVLYAPDDIVFKKDSIENAVRSLILHFPDEDAVIGFRQEGNTFNPAGVALVGNPFINRYPERHLFFPGYFHFSCQEVHRAGLLLHRFLLCGDAVIHHFHPGTHPTELDSTHKEARVFKDRDMKLSADRKARGETWGIGL
jgi:hypothetical protein